MPRKSASVIAARRRGGRSMVKRKRRIVNAMTMVTTRMALTLVTATATEFCVVTFDVSMVRKRTTNSDIPIDGTSRVMDVTSTMAVATTILIEAFNRPGVGASASRRNASHDAGRSSDTSMACVAVVMKFGA